MDWRYIRATPQPRGARGPGENDQGGQGNSGKLDGEGLEGVEVLLGEVGMDCGHHPAHEMDGGGDVRSPHDRAQ